VRQLQTISIVGLEEDLTPNLCSHKIKSFQQEKLSKSLALILMNYKQ